LTDTVVFHVDAMTGRDVIGQTTDGVILAGQDIISGPLVESFFLNNEAKMTILLDKALQVGLIDLSASVVSSLFRSTYILIHL
jgi:hypothetical protein